MNQVLRYILIVAGILLAVYFTWYFINIVSYILISAVLSLIGRPVVGFLGRIHIWKFKIPRAFQALITLLLFWGVFFAFFRIFIPLIVSELNTLSTIDTLSIVETFKEPLQTVENFIDRYQIGASTEFTVEHFITEKLTSVLNIGILTSLFGSFAGLLGNIFIAIFSISFITFFFLKDEHMFAEGILLLVPDKHVEAFKHAMGSTRKLLGRYFVGILGQVTGIITLVTIGLTIVGVGLNHSLLIGLIAGIMNVIPYLGPIFGTTIGLLLGIATHLHLDFKSELLPLVGLMLIVFVIVQLIDNFIFQPLIYSSSVNAHPLEIFLVILLAGSMAGIAGMILAIPVYTVLRVFAKEFFNKFKVVKKLTRKIN